MVQKVLLTIKGTQTEGGQSESIEFVTEGRLYKNADGYLLEYDESELTGEDGVTTQVLLEDKSVTLSRRGSVETHMMFTENEVYESSFVTPNGTVRMSVLALRVQSQVSEKSGSVDLEYELSMGKLSTVNKLNVSYKNLNGTVH